MDTQNLILGAISGDVIGSAYEWNNIKTKDFNIFARSLVFTDDSVLTFATMDVLLNNKDYTGTYQEYARKYPGRGYGRRFKGWINSYNPKPYNSWGNGSAMRVSPVGWACNTIEEVMAEAKRSAEVTHNHPEGIKGAQATAIAVFMARTGKSKDDIKDFITEKFEYNLNRKIDDIRPRFRFDESCQGTVPESIIAFLESTDYETSIKLAISLGGDSDTIACITGGIAEAFYKEIPMHISEKVIQVLPLDILDLINKFSQKYRLL